MWLEGFAIIGMYTAYSAVMTVYLHIKGMVTNIRDFDLDGKWIAASYGAIALILFVGLQHRPNPCPSARQQVLGDLLDDLDEHSREFGR